ncbi:hypothetical protein FC83_GL003324 [Agrilactobacillus composti DSM 18527 = JCM 14202]|uniref:Uncharacterized protein n=2 Tax=Agrilactobacillus TaxID=2767875 RepID=A0A0R1XSS8_9LACO|nr:hypothetical protein FC83_GL003324 [Agrilactobacillus composti DSM 18527 = JCM 14202]
MMKKMRLLSLFAMALLALVLAGSSKVAYAAGQPVDLVARYSIKNMSATTLNTIKQIDAANTNVSTYIQGDTLVIHTLMGSHSNGMVTSPMSGPRIGYQTMDFSQFISKMDGVGQQRSELQPGPVANGPMTSEVVPYPTRNYAEITPDMPVCAWFQN